MKKAICVRPLGVQLGKFQAEVDVIATNVVTGNLIIKSFPRSFKELEFSVEEKCWEIKNEMDAPPNIDGDSEWRRLTKGIGKDEAPVCTTIPVKT